MLAIYRNDHHKLMFDVVDLSINKVINRAISYDKASEIVTKKNKYLEANKVDEIKKKVMQ